MSTHSINIGEITATALKEKKYIDVFPEYYELAEYTENSLWHDHQNVLDHVIGVFAGLETVLQFSELSEDDRFRLRSFLSLQLGSRTR